ncbi:hypothetical protein [Streptomyces solincola]|nr:hypothetical protein [Streptomyces solincola]
MASSFDGELPEAVFDPIRLAAVVESGLLDAAPESAFDDLAQLALAITGADKAFFTVADARRSFWKTAVGTDAAAGRENDIRDSPCHLLVGTGRELIAEEAARDPRIKDLAAIGALDIGAWAGYPVLSPTATYWAASASATTPPDPSPPLSARHCGPWPGR